MSRPNTGSMSTFGMTIVRKADRMRVPFAAYGVHCHTINDRFDTCLVEPSCLLGAVAVP